MKKSLIAVPIGDPAGVGPEIVAKSVAAAEIFDAADCIVVGDKTNFIPHFHGIVMDFFAQKCHTAGILFYRMDDIVDQGRFSRAVLPRDSHNIASRQRKTDVR